MNMVDKIGIALKADDEITRSVEIF